MMSLVIPSFAFAADVDSPVDFGETTVVASSTSKTYNGKKPSFYVYVIRNGSIVDTQKITINAVNAGSYTYYVEGQPLKFTINKATGNKITSKVNSRKVSYKKLKKSSYSFSIGAKASKSSSSLTYKSSSKYVTVNKYGKVTCKKGIKKGTYKVAVTATNKNYKNVVKYIYIYVR